MQIYWGCTCPVAAIFIVIQDFRVSVWRLGTHLKSGRSIQDRLSPGEQIQQDVGDKNELSSPSPRVQQCEQIGLNPHVHTATNNSATM